MRQALVLGIVAAALAAPWQQASAQVDDPVAADFDKFRAVLEKDNPAELFEVKGEQLWHARRGPKNASLEQCDLGLGPGVVKGAYVQLPRYFADVDRVMDAEARIVHCMITLQGFKFEELAKQPFSTPGPRPRSHCSREAFFGPRRARHSSSPFTSNNSAGLSCSMISRNLSNSAAVGSGACADACNHGTAAASPTTSANLIFPSSICRTGVSSPRRARLRTRRRVPPSRPCASRPCCPSR